MDLEILFPLIIKGAQSISLSKINSASGNESIKKSLKSSSDISAFPQGETFLN